MPNVEAIDLFCGAGGLTFGLNKSQIKVVAGVDIDPASRFPFEANNKAKFLEQSVEDVSGRQLQSYYSPGAIKVLVGCAPCQPFSTYSQGPRGKKDNQWRLLEEFSRLVDETKPEIISMENVPALLTHPVFKKFIDQLSHHASGRRRYFVNYGLVKCEQYGLAQARKRMVLIASKYGEISLPAPSGKVGTVKQVIGHLHSQTAGEVDDKDAVHRSAKLSQLNLVRIKASTPGGTWKDWDDNLVADCHKRPGGSTYSSVYGRMEWDKPSPTITTQFYGFGNGRFGHPEQHRALTLREGALLQSFPKTYKFVKEGEQIRFNQIGRLIGNAVPPLLGELIGNAITEHLGQYH
jgi:DNA (cytosine-5)-methyltransferase 1